VWADDLNGDGKLDLLLGDDVTIYHAAEGVEPGLARTKLAEYQAALAELLESPSDDFNQRYQALNKARDEFVKEDGTGFVWVLYRR
jgi:hypothetical protein